MPDSDWQARLEYRRSPEGRQEASVFMKRARAECPVFQTEEYKEKNKNALKAILTRLGDEKVSNGERDLAISLKEIDSNLY